jgi:para-nitrobenzyl esterase
MLTGRMGRILAVVGFMLASVTPATAAEVRTRSGRVAGSTQDGMAVYKGIPFAAPPVGENRWREPMPVTAWSGVKQTTVYGPGCPQHVRVSEVFQLAPLTFNEDCLYLNVWTPAASPNAKLPVMLWLYGGGFTTGSAEISAYSGEHLAKKGVIVVTINYRLGALGFLAHPALTAESGAGRSGNYGLLDQIAALKWVRDNIAAFGGDPNRVTVFGESAGAASGTLLAASPLAKGLFQGVISESGGAIVPQRMAIDPKAVLAASEKQGVDFLAKLGATSIDEARRLPADKLVEAAGPQAVGPFRPITDGVVMVEDPYETYRRGAFNDTPILIGINSDEGAMFSQVATVAAHAAGVRAVYGDHAERILAAYPAATDKEAVRASRDLIRDTNFGWPTWTWARLHTARARGPAYIYYFAHRPPYPDHPAVADWGAAHGQEITYVFGTLDPRAMKWTANDKEISEAMMTYWTNFAKTGDPNGGGLPAWPRFAAGQPRAMVFTDKPAAGPLPNLDKLKAIDEYSKWTNRSGK